MLKIQRTLIVSLLGLVLLAGLVGCGNDKKTPPPVEEGEKALEPPVFPAGSSLERIQQAGKLRVGVVFNQPGFGLKSSVDSKPEGFDVEIAKMMAHGIFGGLSADAERHIEFIEAVSTNRETFLRTNQVDVVIAAYPITDARRAQVDFAGPYYVSHGDVMVSVNARHLQRISDMNGQNVCTKSGSLLIPALRSAAPQVNVVTEDSYSICVQRLKDSVVQGVMSDEVVLAGLTRASNGEFRVLNSNFSNDPYGIGIPKGDDVLREFLNDRLEEVQRTRAWQDAFARTLGQLGLVTPRPPAIDRYPEASTTTSSTGPVQTTTSTSTAPTTKA